MKTVYQGEVDEQTDRKLIFKNSTMTVVSGQNR